MSETPEPRVTLWHQVEFFADVEPHTGGGLDGKYDLYVRDRHNRNLLVFSNQGYENRGDAEAVARKLFGGNQKCVLRVFDEYFDLDLSEQM